MAAIYSSLISSQIDTTWIALFSTHPTRPRQPNNISPMDGHANSIAGQVCACSRLVLISSWLGVTNGEVIEWRLRWWQSNPCQCSLWWAGQVFDNKAHQSSHSTLNTPSIFHNQSMVETFPPRSHAQVDRTKCKNQVTPFDITAKPSQGSKNGFRSLWGSLVSKTQSRNLDAAPPRPMEIKTTHSHVRGRFLVRNFSLS